MADDKVYGFSSEEDVRRIARVVRHDERNRGGSPKRGRYPVLSGEASENILLARADEAISKGASGNASLYEWGTTPAGATDTTETISVYARFVEIGDYAWLLVIKVNDTYYEAIEVECDPETRPE